MRPEGDAMYHFQAKKGSRRERRLSLPKYEYIMRLGRFSKAHDGPLVHAEHHNMPSWAVGDAHDFWEAVDKHERGNAVLYRELEFALPNELSHEQRLSAAQEFAEEICGREYPYTLTIHGNEGNPHCHLLLCDRRQDGITRTPQVFFKKADKAVPERGGCVKADRGPKWVQHVRELWAVVGNRHLDAAGASVRLDHRSYAERGIEQAPTTHLGRSAHRLEKAGIPTARGARNRDAQTLNQELGQIQQILADETSPNRMSSRDPLARRRAIALV